MSKRDCDSLVRLWSACFADYDASTVRFALIALINTSPYAPNIADVKGYITRMEEISAGTPSDGEMWGILQKAVRNGYYGYREEFDRLPEELKAYVGAPEQLRAWALIDEATFNSVHQSNFMKNFKTVRQRAKESKALPQDIRELLAKQRSKMMLPDTTACDENEKRNELLGKLERL